MKRSTSVLLCVAVSCALSITAASGAYGATPEYKACAKTVKVAGKFTGAFINKACTETSPGHEGKYELAAPTVPAAVKGKVGKIDIYLYDPKTEKIEGHFECAKGKDTGTITSTTEGTVSVAYSGCQATGALAGPCNSPAQKPGVVVTETLATRLVWLNEAEDEPGIQFAASTPGGPLTAVVCAGGAETAELVGTMTGKVEPTPGASKAQTFAFNASSVNGAPEFMGQWSGGLFQSEPLKSNLKGVKEFEGVPTGQSSTFSQKGPSVLIG